MQLSQWWRRRNDSELSNRTNGTLSFKCRRLTGMTVTQCSKSADSSIQMSIMFTWAFFHLDCCPLTCAAAEHSITRTRRLSDALRAWIHICRPQVSVHATNLISVYQRFVGATSRPTRTTSNSIATMFSWVNSDNARNLAPKWQLNDR